MDKFFMPGHDIPALPKDQIDRMTEVALSYRQHAPANESARGTIWSRWWIGALSTAACVILVFSIVSLQGTGVTSEQADSTGTSVGIASAETHDAYADITEIAILNTLDGM